MNPIKARGIEMKIQKLHKKNNGNQIRIFKNPNLVWYLEKMIFPLEYPKSSKISGIQKNPKNPPW